MRPLLVEDDERIVEFLRRGLQAMRYSVDVVNAGPDGLEDGQSDQYQVILLDLMLTAKDALADVVEGLRLGADDYMTKPFLFVELLELLMSAAGKVVSRAQVLESVWGASSDPLTNMVDAYIRRLRAKIDAEGGDSWIATIRRRGYRMAAPDST